MFQKILIVFISVILLISCGGNKEAKVETQIKYDEVYSEALAAINKGEYFFASNKFQEIQLLTSNREVVSKSLLLSGYCLYMINFYSDSKEQLNMFIKKYPSNKDVAYAEYLLAMISYENILDEKKDIQPLIDAKEQIENYLKKYKENDYALDLRFKLDLVNNQLAAKEMYLARYYIKKKKWIPATNRLKYVVENYQTTIFIEEALHRLVEVYHTLGLKEQANRTANILGYNYNSSEWYKRSYQVLNKNYKIPTNEEIKTKKNEEDGLIKRTIKKILG